MRMLPIILESVRMRGCGAGELELVGKRVNMWRVCLGRKVRGEYTGLRVSVKVRHSVYKGSVHVRTVWSAWGQTRFMQCEFVSTPVGGRHCERGWGR